jgi:hypothetical protein
MDISLGHSKLSGQSKNIDLSKVVHTKIELGVYQSVFFEKNRVCRGLFFEAQANFEGLPGTSEQHTKAS